MVPKHMLHGTEKEMIIQVAPHIEIIKTSVIEDEDNKLIGVDWELVKAIHKDYDGDAVMVYYETDKFKNVSTLEEISMQMHKEAKKESIGRRTAFWRVVDNKCSTGGGHNMRIAAMAAGHVASKSSEWFKKFARWARVELETGVNSKKASDGGRRLGWGGICYRWLLKKDIADRERRASNALRTGSMIAAITEANDMKAGRDAGPFENALAQLSNLRLNYRVNRHHFSSMIKSERHKFYFNGSMDNMELLRRQSFVQTMNHRVERLKTCAGHMFKDNDAALAWVEKEKTNFDEIDMEYRWKIMRKGLTMTGFHKLIVMLYYKGDKAMMAWLHGKYRESLMK